jgi:hypothetical protein
VLDGEAEPDALLGEPAGTAMEATLGRTGRWLHEGRTLVGVSASQRSAAARPDRRLCRAPAAPEGRNRRGKRLDAAGQRLALPLRKQHLFEHVPGLRTKVNPHKTDAFYATRDLGCLLEDAYKELRAAEKRRADRDAAFTAMLIERVVIERAFLHPAVPAEGSTIDSANLVDTTQRIAEGLFAIAESIDRLAEANRRASG